MIGRITTLGFLLIAGAGPTSAGNIVFRDGFESGSTCAWGGTCPAPAAVTGTWLFDLDFTGQDRQLAVLLHQRAGGDVVGYVVGGTPHRVVTSGSYASGTLTLDLLLERPDEDRAVHLVATVAGELATGSATGALGMQSVRLVRWSEALEERRWVAIDASSPPGAGADKAAFLAVALRPSGELMAGGFAAADIAGCLWACDGGITSFSDDGVNVTFGLETDGGCSAGSSASMAFDLGSRIWVGSATFTDCSGTVSGPIIGSPTTITRTDDAAEILAAVAGVADQLEASTAFTAPHPSFTDDYLHEGRDLSQILTDLNTELATWDDIEVGLSKVRRISTVAPIAAHPEVIRPDGIELEESRSGVPVGGGPRQLYLDPADNPFDDINDNPFSVAGLTPSGWRLSGDHQPTFDLPLVTEPVGPTDTRMRVATPGGTVYVSLGPYGAHFGPLTGHMWGDGKPNLVGFMAANESELEELIGDGSGDDDGVCEAGEACAFWGGLDGSLVRDRTPSYVAPHDGEITALTFYRLPSGNYFDDTPQWVMRVRFPSQVEYRLGHVGAIAPVIADAVLSATGCDPRAWESCTGVVEGTDLLEGAAPIPVTAGVELCQPQVLADPVPGYPGYFFVNGGPFGQVPWAQMEFFTDLPVEIGGTEGCPYLAIPTARREELRGVMERDMLDPTSLRYGDSPFTSRWKWTAEATLCTAPTRIPVDFSSLLTSHGGWFERSGAGTVQDEAVAFVRMFPDTTVYDPTNYDPATQLLIARQRNFGSFFEWTMPDMSVVEAFYPAGELRELDGDSFLVKWRELGWTAGDLPVYQRAAYRLDENGLTIRWGPFAADPASAVQPVLAPGTPCDELEVICYSHESLSTI